MNRGTLRQQTLTVTTATGGAGTATGDVMNGILEGVYWNVGTGSAGIDATLTIGLSGFAATPLTLTDANSSAYYYPRASTCTVAGATNSDAGANIICIGKPVLTIAQGGDAHTCSMVIFWWE